MCYTYIYIHAQNHVGVKNLIPARIGSGRPRGRRKRLGLMPRATSGWDTTHIKTEPDPGFLYKCALVYNVYMFGNIPSVHLHFYLVLMVIVPPFFTSFSAHVVSPGWRERGKSVARNSGDTVIIYPLVNIQKAIENGHLKWVFPLKIVIFHSYVSLPEGRSFFVDKMTTILWKLLVIYWKTHLIFRQTHVGVQGIQLHRLQELLK